MILLRTRLAVLTGTALLATSLLAASGVASAAPSSAAMQSCDGLPATLVVAAPGMVTFGGNSADVIIGTNGNDTIIGLGGDDHICARGGDDTMRGNDGNDRMDGAAHIEGDLGDGGPGMDICVRTETVISC